jgi:hypothetical protein
VKNYFRYADDFIIMHQDQNYLKLILAEIQKFLKQELALKLHPQKIQIRKFCQGIDFLGYIILPHYVVLRTKTKNRMFRKMKIKRQRLETGLINQESFNQSLQSYLGMLKHCFGYKIKQNLKRQYPPLTVFLKFSKMNYH